MPRVEEFIRGLPKTDLHMHLEGSLEPELLLKLAGRNRIQLKWSSADALRSAYEFDNLQTFLDLYYAGCEVLVTEQDFYELTHAYVRRAQADGVIRAEVFIGPQSFTTRGTPIATVIDGTLAAIHDAERDGTISVGLIITAQRHRTEADAFALLEQLRPWQGHILGIGMGGAEVGNPPSKFVNFFRACRDAGFRLTIHAGEEGPASYVREALELLDVDRIDHGVACLQDPELVAELARRQVALTVCPISNLRLKVVPSIAAHPLKTMLAHRLHVTVNSDDPAYFGGYASENLLACQRELDLSIDDVISLVRNGFTAAFLPDAERSAMLSKLEDYVARFDWTH